MRIDSCRNCGAELKVIELCIECDQPTSLECEHCRKFIDSPVHLHSKMISRGTEIPVFFLTRTML